jgi:hypothetical protein
LNFLPYSHPSSSFSETLAVLGEAWAQTIKNDIFSKPDSVGKKIGSVCVGGDERHKAA